MRVSAVRARYEHISHHWRPADAERRAAFIGELELLLSQLPVAATGTQDDDDVAALRADITKLVTAITIDLSDTD